MVYFSQRWEGSHVNRIWKSITLILSLLLILCAAAGCTPAETGPEFETAFIYSEYGEMVGQTECLVDGDPASESLARVEIESNSVNSKKSTYKDLASEYGLGLTVLSDENGDCHVYTVDKIPVIKVLDWEGVYYVIPAQSEEAAWEIYGNYMHALAESMGIAED